MTGALVLLAILCAMGGSVCVTASSPSLTTAQSAWLWSIAQNKAPPSAWPGLQASQAEKLHQRTVRRTVHPHQHHPPSTTHTLTQNDRLMQLQAAYEVTLWADNMPFNQTVGTVWTGANATGSVYEYDDVSTSKHTQPHTTTASTKRTSHRVHVLCTFRLATLQHGRGTHSQRWHCSTMSRAMRHCCRV